MTRNQRALAIAAVAIAVIGWTAFLVDSSDETNFDVFVKVMGSAGILLAIFLVARPRPGSMENAFVGRNEMLEATDPSFETPVRDPNPTARGVIVTLTVALALGSIYYRVSQGSELHQSSAFFIGLPAILAITLAFTPRAKSATGMIMKGMTLALLLSGVVLSEGFVCILMAAPLFYLVGAAVGLPIDHARKKKRSQVGVFAIVGIVAAIMSLEGVTPATSFPTRDSVTVARVVDASSREVRAALARPPRFTEELPTYLKLGFPRPVAARGRGLAVGDRRVIVFGDESPMEPMSVDADGHHHHPVRDGRLVLRVASATPGRVVFEQVGDQTAFTHWVSLERSIVEWAPTSDGRTRIEWTMDFERRLSPAWYFAPWQRYAARLASGYLIESAATP